MKKILFSLLIISSSLAQAATTSCSQNSYALTKQSLVVAYDWAEGGFSETTGHHVLGEFYFNSLRDQSCQRIEVASDGVVRCISNKAQKTQVGVIQEKQGRHEEWDFFNVNWNSNVVIKAQNTNSGCIYGIAVQP